jgi:lysozyme family protein
MPKIQLTETLRKEYENLFNSCIIRPDRIKTVDDTMTALLSNRGRYQSVGDATGIPWNFIAVIHSMEASLSFSKHLHNGDPLTARTKQVPAGRPIKGTPPFTWEESAVDALTMKGLGSSTDWGLAGTLYQLENYNGWGYRLYHQHVLSPYLWSFSNHYNSGKYIADGTWSDTAVSKQCGAATLIRRMAEQGTIEFPDQPAPAAGSAPLVVNYSMQKSSNPTIVLLVENLQIWLNSFPGIFVKIDGIPGDHTSEAYRKVTGIFLPGDPRG